MAPDCRRYLNPTGLQANAAILYSSWMWRTESHSYRGTHFLPFLCRQLQVNLKRALIKSCWLSQMPVRKHPHAVPAGILSMTFHQIKHISLHLQ